MIYNGLIFDNRNNSFDSDHFILKDFIVEESILDVSCFEAGHGPISWPIELNCVHPGCYWMVLE